MMKIRAIENHLGTFKEAAEIETGMAEKSSWNQANRQQKLMYRKK
jgi:hypothetical protein